LYERIKGKITNNPVYNCDCKIGINKDVAVKELYSAGGAKNKISDFGSQSISDKRQ